jgi:O-antigen/teichoic acid export membrane protein
MAVMTALFVRGLAPLSFVLMLFSWQHLADPKKAGELVVLLAGLAVISRLARFGFDQLLYRNSLAFKEGGDVAGNIWSAFMIWALPVAILLAIGGKALSVSSSHIDVFDEMPVEMIIVLALLMVSANATSSLAQTMGHTFMAVLCFPVLAYGIVALSAPLQSPKEWSLVGGFSLSAVLVVFALVALKPAWRVTSPFPWLKQTAAYGCINVTSMALDWGMTLAVAGVLGVEEALVFNLSTRIGALLAMPMTVLTPFVQPRVASMQSSGQKAGLRKFSALVLIIALSIQIAIGAGLVLFADDLRLVPLNNLNTFLVCIAIYALAQFINVLTGPSASILTMGGNVNSVAFLYCSIGVAALIGSVSMAANGGGVIGVVSVIAFGMVLQNIGYAAMLYRKQGTIPLVDAARLLSGKVQRWGK